MCIFVISCFRKITPFRHTHTHIRQYSCCCRANTHSSWALYTL